MKQTQYTGLFKSEEDHQYKIVVYGFGFIEALILLTAEAIKSGKHYQLHTITDEDHNCTKRVDSILKISSLFID